MTPLSLCSLSPVMHSAMGDEHGEPETPAGSSWDPSLQGPGWGQKEKGTGGEPAVHVQGIHPGDGNGHSWCDGTVGGEATGGAGWVQEGLLVSSGH